MRFCCWIVAFCCCSCSLWGQIPVVSSGKIERIEQFSSRYVDARQVDIWLPDGYSRQQKYAVLYMHDGQMLFDSSLTWNKQAWEVDETAASLMATGQTRKFIVVGIWNNGAKRHAEYFPQQPFEQLTQTERDSISSILRERGRTTGDFQPISDRYLRFLVKELKPYIDRHYSTKKDRANTFIAGSSMGGLISMYAMVQYPKVFGGAACISTHWPGTFSVKNNPIPGAFERYLKEKLPKPGKNKFYFDYGTATLDALYPDLQVKIDAVLKEKGYTPAHWTTQRFEGADHSEKSWRTRLHIPLLFLLTPP